MTSHQSDALAARQRDTWTRNAPAWTRAVRSGRIASRRVTDAAILEAVEATGARRVLDVGCGEGWLVRRLAEAGCEATGIDASAPLIASAREGAGRFLRLSYEEAVARPGRLPESVGAAVCNFSLLDEHVGPLLGALRARLKPAGTLLVQTVHPFTARGDQPYRDGWRQESFDGFGDGFSELMPWYYRTMGSWIGTVRDAGFAVERCIEPTAEGGDVPLSLLLVCSSAGAVSEG